MVQPIRSLDDVQMKGGSIKATCRSCGRVAFFDPGELVRYFRRMNWDRSWPLFARKIRCRPPLGCGARQPDVTWIEKPPPTDDDPKPPRPRFARAEPIPIGTPQREHVGRRLRVVKRKAA